jgi:deoxyribonuclease IV
MSIKDGYFETVKAAIEDYKANALMTFLRSPRSAQPSAFITDEEARIVKDYILGNRLFYVAHSIYLINLAKALTKNKWALEILIDDLYRINKLGGTGVIIHMGKSLNQISVSEAKENFVRSINHCLSATNKIDSKIILENTAGQGSEFGFKFEEIRDIYNQIENQKRIGVCLDTQHSFAAGYDWNYKPDKIFKEFDDTIGLDHLTLMHLNNSKKELASRVDRHENLGKGLLSEKAIIKIVKFADKNNIPLILETPVVNGDEHKNEIAWCKKQLKIKD